MLNAREYIEPGQTGLYGVEIEFENSRTGFRPPIGWNQVPDGSLRNNGTEFVSYPMDYNRIREAVHDLYTAIGPADRTRFLGTTRTGIHVHYYVGHYNAEELETLLCLYALVEPVMFLIAGNEREENTFCIPWYRTPVEVARRIASDDIARFCKYSALNLSSIYRFGTVEFRHAPTYPTFNGLEEWLFAIMRITRVVERGSVNKDRIKECLGNTRLLDEYIHMIFDRLLIRKMEDSKISSLAEECVKRGSESTVANILRGLAGKDNRHPEDDEDDEGPRRPIQGGAVEINSIQALRDSLAADAARRALAGQMADTRVRVQTRASRENAERFYQFYGDPPREQVPVEPRADRTEPDPEI